MENSEKLTQQQNKFPEIEKRLIEYVEAISRRYQRDDCFISFSVIPHKCHQWAEQLNITVVKASNRWLGKILTCYDNNLVTIYVKADDMTAG